MIPPAPPESATDPRPWWETRPFVAFLVLASMIPLLYPPIPPLVDLFGHMGRYRVELDLTNSPDLQRYFGFDWKLIGNLGVDLLVYPLGKLIGLEPAVKLIVLAIPPLTVAGMLWVAREVHHRLPPTVLFALPFAYGQPFLFGFLNFSLSMALAFLAFGLWLRLGRLEKLGLRATLFVPISILVWVTHAFGWGMLGLFCFSAEAVRLHDKGRHWLAAGCRAGIEVISIAPPLILMLLWRSEGVAGQTDGWFMLSRKWTWIIASLRDRWQLFDLASIVIAFGVLLLAIGDKRLVLSRNLLFSAFVLALAFLLLPWEIFGSAYADMRLVPFLWAILLLAIRFRDQTDLRLARMLAIAGLAFFLIRIGATSASLAMAAHDQRGKLEALDHVPPGARVYSIVGHPCDGWAMTRDDHLPSLVIERRNGFTNDQWVIAGANLLELRYRDAGWFGYDPSQIVLPDGCARLEVGRIGWRLSRFPRAAFDYLWLIDPPAFDHQLLGGAQLVWQGPRAALYRLRPTPVTSRP